MDLVPQTEVEDDDGLQCLETTPATPGSRLHFSWGSGTQIRLVEVFSPVTGIGGEDPVAAFRGWGAPEAEHRQVAYNVIPLYKELRRELQQLGLGRQADRRKALKAYSSSVLDILTAVSRPGGDEDGAPSTVGALQVAYEAGLWQVLDLFFLSDDTTEGFFAEAFASWLAEHGGLFCSPPGLNQLQVEVHRLLQEERVDRDQTYWPCLQRLLLTGQLELAVQLLTAHPAYQALQDPDMAAKVEALESVYQLLRVVPRFSRAGGSSSGRVAATGTLTDRPAEFAAQRAAWKNRVDQLWESREQLLADLQKLDPMAAQGLLGVLCLLLVGSDNTRHASTAYSFMAKVAHNWVELLSGVLLWKYPTMQPQLHLRQLMLKVCSAAGPVNAQTDESFLDFFEQLLLAACDQEVQSVISLCTNAEYCSLQFVAHIYDVLRGLPGAERVISRPLPHAGGDQCEAYTLYYVEHLMGQASTWQLAAEYLAWCPVHGRDALEALLEKSPFPLQDERSAHKALALAQRHNLTSAAQGLCRRLGMAAAQSGCLAAALQWMLRAHDPARCAELVAPLVQKVQQQLLEQVGSYQAVPLELPELQDLEPLLHHLPVQPRSSLSSRLTRLPLEDLLQQHRPRSPHARPYQELHFLHAFLRLQQALQGLQQCQQRQQHVAQGREQQQQAMLRAAYAAVREPVLELLLEGLAPAQMQLPLLLYLVPVLDSLFTPFTRSDVHGLMQVLTAASGTMPAAAAVLAGTDGALLGLGWPSVVADQGQGPAAGAVASGGQAAHAADQCCTSGAVQRPGQVTRS